MGEGYRLMVRYMHCVGPKEYEVGHADTREEALEWKKNHEGNNRKPFTVPEGDPVRWCPVRHCHMKIQTPVFFFQPDKLKSDKEKPDKKNN